MGVGFFCFGVFVKVYLARFEKNGKFAYKIGHTKYFYPIKRFTGQEYHDQYKIFEEIIILDDINVQHENALIARQMAQMVEACIQGVFPKNFMLEPYFLTEEKAFEGLSGITEMFILEENQTQQHVCNTFARIKKRVEKLKW